jgi:hypothetical protein
MGNYASWYDNSKRKILLLSFDNDYLNGLLILTYRNK